MSRKAPRGSKQNDLINKWVEKQRAKEADQSRARQAYEVGYADSPLRAEYSTGDGSVVFTVPLGSSGVDVYGRMYVTGEQLTEENKKQNELREAAEASSRIEQG